MTLKNSPESIVVIQIGKIGDMILTTPLFSQIKKLFPKSELIVLASEKNHFLADTHNSVDKVLIFKKNLSGVRSFLSLRSSVLKYWIDSKNMYSKTAALLVKNSKPECSLGFNFEEEVFTKSLNEFTFGEHAIDINLSPINFFNNSQDNFSKSVRPEINIPEKDKVNMREKIGRVSKSKNILVNYSAGSENRYLNTDIWIEALNNLSLNNNEKLFITGLAEDEKVIEKIVRRVKNNKLRFVMADNFFEFAAAIEMSDIVITSDTSAVHVCSAYNKPILAFYPDVKWNYEKFKPLSFLNEVIFSDNQNNMDGIDPGSISERLHKILPLI
ncbi:MAG TPA: glycosyltransferase family 9 protein [Ignavibacteria bacterium]|nr:glycosyltransferase family 9 protein [Ignavibacteria bacterium]